MQMEELNAVYFPLAQRQKEFLAILSQQNVPFSSGWFNGHFSKRSDGSYQMDYFPIPVVSITGLCDIELNFDSVTVSTKLSRENALRFCFEDFPDIPFEAYGVEDYLADFYLAGMTAAQLRQNIERSRETEIGFQFRFPTDVAGEALCAFAGLLREKQFYY